MDRDSTMNWDTLKELVSWCLFITVLATPMIIIIWRFGTKAP